MARIFITGSADGLGFLAAQSLLSAGHDVVLHARNTQRVRDVKEKLSVTADVVVGDLANLDQMVSVADQVNRLGQFDAVIHNAGVYPPERQISPQVANGLPLTFAVNVLAPYVLTALLSRPPRLVYLGSGMHLGASADIEDFDWKKRPWNGAAAYAESKLFVVMLAMVFARYWSAVYSNAVDPGWVPTKMGGPAAPDNLTDGYRTQTWLATADVAAVRVSGKYFYHQQQRPADTKVYTADRQEQLLALCQRLAGINIDRG